MNKKGFTIIELVTSITLAAVIMIFLFNLVFILKDVYVSSEKKANLLIEQAAISEEVNSYLYSSVIRSINKCSEGNHCIDVETDKGTKRLTINTSSKKIQFGNYLYKVDDNAIINIDNVKVCYYQVSDTNYNKLLIIDVEINYPGLKGNFGLKSAIPFRGTTDLSTC